MRLNRNSVEVSYLRLIEERSLGQSEWIDHMKWVRKVVLLLVVLFAVFFLVSRPVDAAAAVRGAFDAVSKGFSSVLIFFQSI